MEHDPFYLEAMDESFGGQVDYAQLIKLYDDETGRYAGAEKRRISGYPDPDLITTAHVERHNLTLRMSVRRFTRRTNAHSKKVENHAYALALYFVFYNFCRPHSALGGWTPAMEAGLTDRVHDLRWIVQMVNDAAPKPKRGPYKKQVPDLLPVC